MALAAISLAACNDGDLPPGAQFSAISGIVLDSATQKPLAGATVVVDSVLDATTDATGSFAIARAPSGILDYSVSAPGYAAVSASASSSPGKALAIRVSLVPVVGSPSPAPSP